MNEIRIRKSNGTLVPLDISKIRKTLDKASKGLTNVDPLEVERDSHLVFVDGMSTKDIQQVLIDTCNNKIDFDRPDYQMMAARLLMMQLYKEAGTGSNYRHLKDVIEYGISEGVYSEKLREFDLEKLNSAIDKNRDKLFTYYGLVTAKDRYLKYDTKGELFELPQHFFMRVAMGVSLNEEDKTKWAIKFYDNISNFYFSPSTPILSNSGTPWNMMISCFVGATGDSTHSRAKSDLMFAVISSLGGGRGEDITEVRGLGSPIRKRLKASKGIVPFIKAKHFYAKQYDQAGTRNGSTAVSIQPWHIDVNQFIDLKLQHGDADLRVLGEGIYPTLWIPDLLFKRAYEGGGKWTLFDPYYVSDLIELYGEAFEKRYKEYEEDSSIPKVQLDAMEFYHKIIVSIDQTGSPFMAFKDNANRTNPQGHVGTIRSTQLCLEIFANSKPSYFEGYEVTENGVIEKWTKGEENICDLASVNLSRAYDKLDTVVPTALRMLDNVLDINLYPTGETSYAAMKHRNVGLGVMGEAELIADKKIMYGSEDHRKFVSKLYELFSYHATKANIELGKERGNYPTFEGSTWNRGIFTHEMYGKKPVYSRQWESLREDMIKYSRFANTTAIAPTGTISVLFGTTPTIEPVFKKKYNEQARDGRYIWFVPRNMSIDTYQYYVEAKNIDQIDLIKTAAERQPWLTQGMSLNIFKGENTTIEDLMVWYYLAWKLGLKSTYYLKNFSKDNDTEEEESQFNVKCSGCE
jgi:ribonucleoside-diphosphate reductase alpha chain